MANNNQSGDSSADRYITNATYPLNKADLLQYAEDQGAPNDVMDKLRKLPDQEYNDMNSVKNSLK